MSLGLHEGRKTRGEYTKDTKEWLGQHMGCGGRPGTHAVVGRGNTEPAVVPQAWPKGAVPAFGRARARSAPLGWWTRRAPIPQNFWTE